MLRILYEQEVRESRCSFYDSELWIELHLGRILTLGFRNMRVPWRGGFRSSKSRSPRVRIRPSTTASQKEWSSREAVWWFSFASFAWHSAVASELIWCYTVQSKYNVRLLIRHYKSVNKANKDLFPKKIQNAVLRFQPRMKDLVFWTSKTDSTQKTKPIGDLQTPGIQFLALIARILMHSPFCERSDHKT